MADLPAERIKQEPTETYSFPAIHPLHVAHLSTTKVNTSATENLKAVEHKTNFNLPLSMTAMAMQSSTENLFPGGIPSIPDMSLMEPLANLESAGKKSSPRNVLTLQEKVDVIKLSESTGKSQRQLAAQFKISKTQVMEILRNKETIKMALDENILNPDRKRLYIKKNRHKFPHLVAADNLTQDSSKNGSNILKDNCNDSFLNENTSVFPSHGFNDLSLCYGNQSSGVPLENPLEKDFKAVTSSLHQTVEVNSNQIVVNSSDATLSISNNTTGSSQIDLKAEPSVILNKVEPTSNIKIPYINLSENGLINCSPETVNNEDCKFNTIGHIKSIGTIQESSQLSSPGDLEQPQQQKPSPEKGVNRSTANGKSVSGNSKGNIVKKPDIRIEDKIRLIMTCKKKSQPLLAREFGITQKEVFEILRDRDEIEDQYRLKRKQMSESLLQDMACGPAFTGHSAPVQVIPLSFVTENPNQNMNTVNSNETEDLDKNDGNSENVTGNLISTNMQYMDQNLPEFTQMQEYLNQNWSIVEENAAESGKIKRKRTSLSIEDKMLILQHKGGKSLRETALTFGIGKTTVLDIFKRGDEITKAFYDESMNPQRKKMRTWKRTELNYAKVDQAVYLWYKSMVDKGIHLSGPKVQKQAAALAQKLEMTKFKASNGWLAGFCKRHRVCFSNSRKPKLPDESVEVGISNEILTSANNQQWPNLYSADSSSSSQQNGNAREVFHQSSGITTMEGEIGTEEGDAPISPTSCSSAVDCKNNISFGQNEHCSEENDSEEMPTNRSMRPVPGIWNNIDIKSEPLDPYEDPDYNSDKNESSDDSIPEDEDCE